MLRMASKKGLAGLRPARRFLSAAAVGHKPSTDFDLKSNVLEFADQTVFAGTESLNDMFSALKDLGYSKPLLVTDAGIHKLGMLGDIQGQMEQGFGFSTAVFAECVPNPGVADIAGIAQAFLENDCDVCVGVGGGGPLDAAKGGMALVAKKRIDQTFDLKVNGFLKRFESSGIVVGCKDLVPEGAEGKDVEVLAELAANDGCQTNPVPLDKTDYHQIFARAASM
eukprot:jgi/Bigna1/126103/aug1.2_g811